MILTGGIFTLVFSIAASLGVSFIIGLIWWGVSSLYNDIVKDIITPSKSWGTPSFNSQSSVSESPIEELFWNAAKQHIDGLIPQYCIGHYRVDFAVPQKYVAIELDGHEYHKTKEQRTADARRERDLQELGWQVIRFTGTEIYTNVKECIEQARRICEQTKWQDKRKRY